MHYLPGNIGHWAVIVSFVSALLSAFAYWSASNTEQELDKKSWSWLGRGAFAVHILSVFAVVGALFYIIYNHYYEYHYAWSHSSNHLPTHYMISCFWEGQEGSFLLWIFWHAILGAILIRSNKNWEQPVLAIFMMVQAFLCSMILGIGFDDLKIGSSPFILMREAMPDIPVFSVNPDYVPEDGRGLNPLLQNYWMVIHPPTLFLGFAMTLVPFCYAIAGLWKKQYDSWVRPALPWSLATALILGIGILMGGYWAYETLNFGGYWNWDPVENAVYIPWLVLVAAIHTLIAYRKGGVALRVSYLLVIASFILVLYATFLTRSGILGNASVHSFTDLGLSGQLLMYLLTFTVVAIMLLVLRWKQIPITQKELDLYNRDTWIFLGVTVLCLASFQVLVTTSIPVYNSIAKAFGLSSELAPPADAIAHYTNWQMWFMIGVALLSAIGQVVWWRKPGSVSDAWKDLIWPVAIAIIAASAFVATSELESYAYIVLVIAAVFSIATNASVVWRLTKTNMTLSGGAITHIGVGLMLVGILFSAGYSKVVSVNTSGLVYRKEFSTEMNRDNVLLWRGTPTKMGNDYELTYRGNAYEVDGFPTFVKKEFLLPTNDDYRMIVTTGDLSYGGKTYFKRGDTVGVRPENTYYAIQYVSAGDTFVLFPRAQVNPNMGLLASPDIKRFASFDLYTHVSSVPKPGEEHEWSEPQEFKAQVGDTLFLNDYVAQLVAVQKLDPAVDKEYGPFDAGVKAIVRILGRDQVFIAEPTFIIRGNEIGRKPQELGELGIRVSLNNIDPETATFSLGVSTSQRDWVIMKAVKKPLINLLWIGTIVLIIGFGFAIRRRVQDFIKLRDKGLDWADAQ